ncbi:MAG: PQQ-binding-like beta-propeller repeat protein [Planctomycetes bacterium]|nr:PQQ-binding-like beta-propeller repeat protein [Planctomycetota bacterium]
METTFHGNITKVGLGEILQTLASGGKVGVLAVNSRDRRAEVLLAANEVALAEGGFDDRPGLPHQCFALGLMDEAALRQVLDARVRTGRSYYDLLRKDAGVPAQDIEGLRRLWHQDRLLSLFHLKEGTFSYREDPSAGRRLAGGAIPAFPVDAVVMEAARQQDEWTLIRVRIPHDQAVLEPVSGSAPSGEHFAHVSWLLDGKTPIAEAAEKSYLTRFELARTCHQFLETGVFRLVGPDELLERARGLGAGDADSLRRSLVLYESYLADRPGDRTALLEEGHVCWKLGRPAEAADLYARAIPGLVEEGREPEAFELIETGLEAVPEHRGLEDAVALFLPSHVEAVGERASKLLERALRLADRRTRESDATGAYELVEAILSTDPSNYGAREKAINLSIDLKSAGNAVVHYEAMATRLAASGEWSRVVDVYQRIQRLDPRRAGIDRKLHYARQQLVATSPVHARRRGARRAAWFAALLAVLAVAYGQWRPYAEYRDLDVEGMAAARRYPEALDILARFREEHPLAIAGVLAGRRERAVQGEFVRYQEDRSREMEKDLARVRGLETDGDFPEALTALEGILGGPLTDDFRGEVEDYRTQVAGLALRLAELQAEADRHRLEGDIGAAFGDVGLIVKEFGARPFVRQQIEVPILLVSYPPQARLEFTDGASARVGTDGVILVPYGQMVQARFSLDGYEAVERTIGTEDWRVEVRLAKQALWVHDTGTVLESGPAVAGGLASVRTPKGEVVAYSLSEGGQEKWRFRLEGRSRISGELVGAGTDFYFSATGDLYRIGESGGAVWQRPTGGVTAGTPVLLESAGLVAAVVDDLRVAFHRAGDGEPVWLASTGEAPGAEIVAPPAVLPGGRVVVALSGGELVCLDSAARTVAWRRKLSGRPAWGPVVAAGRVAVAAPTLLGELQLQAFRTEDGEPVWQRIALRGLAVPPTPAGETLFLVGESGRVEILAAADGKPAPALPDLDLFDFDLASQPVVAGPGLVAIGKDGSVVAFDASSGRALWFYQLPAPTAGPPAAWGDRILLATQDGRLIALSR